MQDAMGQPVIVDPNTAAGGGIAAAQVLKGVRGACVAHTACMIGSKIGTATLPPVWPPPSVSGTG
mgnify:CR=1 FL=1